MSDKIFTLAVFISFLIHVGVFLSFFIKKNDLRIFKEPETTFSVQHVQPKPKPPPELFVQKMETITAKDVEIRASGVPTNVSKINELYRESSGLTDPFKIYERQPEKLKGIKVTREVSVPMLKSEKINTPSYVTYYQIVRDRIRDRAYSNYTKLSVGEVYITFVIKSDGALGPLQIMENRSTANDFLKEVGQKSVREAAPFPPFPPDLNYPELTFNVSISFQYHEE